MKISIYLPALADVLQQVTKVVSAKSNIPILSGVKFDVQEDGLVLTTSDASTSIVKHLAKGDNLKIKETGGIVIEAKDFVSIVKACITTGDHDANMVDLTTDPDHENQLIIKTANGKFNMMTLPITNYPHLTDDSEQTKLFTIKTTVLQDVIKKLAFNASDKGTFPAMAGIQFNLAEGKLAAVSTDSYRMGRLTNIEIENASQNKETFILKADDLRKISTMLASDEIQVSTNDMNQFILKADNDLMILRTMDGTYPETNRIFKSINKERADGKAQELILDRSDLIKAIRQVTVFSGDKNYMTLKTTKDSSEMVLTSSTVERGKSDVKLNLAKPAEFNEAIALNPSFVKEAVQAIDDDTVNLYINKKNLLPIEVIDPTKPNNFMQIITPIRTY